MKNFLTTFTHIFLLVLILQACGGGDNDRRSRFSQMNNANNREDRGTSVETVKLETDNISQQIRSYGTIQAKDVVNITPLVSDRITRIYVDIGDTVRQGQKLAEINQKPFREQLKQVRATLEQNLSALERDSAEFIRQKKLYEQQLVSSTVFEQARATYLSSKSQVESARAAVEENLENLSNTTIKSPVFGVIVSRPLSEGDIATTGTTVFEIANIVGFETRVYLPLEEWRMVKTGQPVSLSLSNQSGINARGRVTRINPRLDPTTGLGEVIITLTETGSSVYQGVLVESIINVRTNTNTVVIPRSALVENVETVIDPESNSIQLERNFSAFVVQNETLAVKKDLTLGIQQGDRVEVLEGLEPGEELIVTGQSGLTDKAKVRVAGKQQFTPPDRQQLNQSVADTSQRPQRGNRSRGSSSTNSNN